MKVFLLFSLWSFGAIALAPLYEGEEYLRCNLREQAQRQRLEKLKKITELESKIDQLLKDTRMRKNPKKNYFKVKLKNLKYQKKKTYVQAQGFVEKHIMQGCPLL
jgi:hypothetical protein